MLPRTSCNERPCSTITQCAQVAARQHGHIFLRLGWQLHLHVCDLKISHRMGATFVPHLVCDRLQDVVEGGNALRREAPEGARPRFPPPAAVSVQRNMPHLSHGRPTTVSAHADGGPRPEADRLLFGRNSTPRPGVAWPNVYRSTHPGVMAASDAARAITLWPPRRNIDRVPRNGLAWCTV